MANALEHALAAWSTRLAPRELEERAAGAEDDLSTLLSLALPCGAAADPALERRAFELVETQRGVGDLRAVRVGAGTANDDAVRAAAAELARRAQAGATNAELERARRALDDLQRDLRARAERADVAIGADALAARLGPDRALAAFRGYTRCELDAAGAAVESRHLAAFVLRGDGALARVELGPLAAVDAAAEAWRAAVLSPGARGLAAADAEALETRAGESLRALVLDPLVPHLAGRTRVVLLLDGALHLAPFDALPLDGQGTPAGTRYSFEVHTSARSVGHAPVVPVGDRLVAVGGIDYDAGFDASAAREPGAWEPAFALLPAADAEVQTVALYHERAFGADAARTLLRGASATRAAVESALPGARFVHFATHGWFTAEAVRVAASRSVLDPGLGIPASDARELVRRTSPALMCGLALAGANLPPDGSGRTVGRISAEEIATLDLSACELAVLSACETNLGVQRAGQGVASLQKALHAAGAGQVITSSWRVPDEATKELMSDFYRRVWVERKPVRTALWEAKSKLREARDARGQRTHATRDWAAWVLSGGA